MLFSSTLLNLMDKKHITLIALFLSFILGVTLLLKNESVVNYLMDFLDTIRDSGLKGWLLLVFLTVAMNLAAIPMSIFDLSVGYIYPIPYAFLTLIFVRMLSATGCFLIANYICKERAYRTFVKEEEKKDSSRIEAKNLSIF